jgi:hypothetical protein
MRDFMMSAIALYTLFSIAALLAVATMVEAWRKHFGRFAELREELRAANRGVAVRCTWRDGTMPRPAATVYNLRFMPTAECLPFHPEHELRVAA